MLMLAKKAQETSVLPILYLLVLANAKMAGAVCIPLIQVGYAVHLTLKSMKCDHLGHLI